MNFLSGLLSAAETGGDIGQYLGLDNKYEVGGDIAGAAKKAFEKGVSGDTVGDFMGIAADGLITSRLITYGLPNWLAVAIGEAAQLLADRLGDGLGNAMFSSTTTVGEALAKTGGMVKDAAATVLPPLPTPATQGKPLQKLP